MYFFPGIYIYIYIYKYICDSTWEKGPIALKIEKCVIHTTV